ncbi:MAG: NADH-quinone oxidoreductase subunit J [Planctomycetota bacterium]|nr:NADH-quinone oxidoreductase subunit J [Planctomycetota bacterium]
MSELNRQRLFYTVLAFLAFGSAGKGLLEAGVEGLMFSIFASLTLGGAAVCIWERSVVRSAFALMATFLGVAGFFLILGSDFLAMAQVLIYVGGVLALLLFGVMLTKPDLNERSLPRIGAATALIGGGIAFLVSQMVGVGVKTWAMAETLEEPTTKAHDIGIAFLDPKQYVVAFELAAFLLTVALVAAVYIARRRTEDFTPEEGQV